MRGNTNTVRRGAILNASGAAIGMIMLFTEGMIVSRNLSVHDNGTFFLMLTIVSVWMIPADAGLKASATQRLAASRTEERGQLAADLLWTRVVFTLIIAGTLWITRTSVASLFSLEFYEENLNAILVLLIVVSLDEMTFSLLRGFQSHRALAALQILRSGTRLSITAFLVLVAGWDLNALVLSWAVALALAVVAGILMLPVRLKRPRIGTAHLKAELALGRPHIATRALTAIRNHGANILLFQFVGIGAVAAYAFALRIPSGLQTLLESYNNVVYPRLSELRSSRGKEREASELLSRSICTQTYLLSGIALAGSIVADQLMSFLWSTTYRDAGMIFTILLASLVFQVSNATLGYSMLSANKARLNAILLLAGTLLYLALAILLSATLADGRLGPAIAALAEGLVLFFVMIAFARRSLFNVSFVASSAGPLLALALGALRLLAMRALGLDSVWEDGAALSILTLVLYGAGGVAFFQHQRVSGRHDILTR